MERVVLGTVSDCSKSGVEGGKLLENLISRK